MAVGPQPLARLSQTRPGRLRSPRRSGTNSIWRFLGCFRSEFQGGGLDGLDIQNDRVVPKHFQGVHQHSDGADFVVKRDGKEITVYIRNHGLNPVLVCQEIVNEFDAIVVGQSIS